MIRSWSGAQHPAFFASLAGSLFALGHLHEVFGWFDIEYFTGFVSDDLLFFTADPANALLGCAWDDLFDPLQMRGQLLTPRGASCAV